MAVPHPVELEDEPSGKRKDYFKKEHTLFLIEVYASIRIEARTKGAIFTLVRDASIEKFPELSDRNVLDFQKKMEAILADGRVRRNAKNH